MSNAIHGIHSSSSHPHHVWVAVMAAWLDQVFASTAQVVVVAETRQSHQIHPMLKRFGRLDTEISFPMPTDVSRSALLQSLLFSAVRLDSHLSWGICYFSLSFIHA